jgi:GTP 3',8-cyclase
MRDNFQRNINYLRLSVTDRCNLRCIYCRPAEGLDLSNTRPILAIEELYQVAHVAVTELGIPKLRLTGGEPLYRRGIVDLVRLLSPLPGLEDLGMTTNAVMLPHFAADLKEAGLQRVNISLDSMDPDEFRRVTRNGNLEQVLAGIDAALAAGLTPVKLNCVIDKTPDEPDAVAVQKYADSKGIEVRFIRRMDMEKGEFWQVKGGSGGNCAECGRLRITSTGEVLPCLFSDMAFDVREMGIREALEAAVGNKPKSGKTSTRNRFYTVGG